MSRKRWKWILIYSLLAFVVIAACGGGYMWFSMQKTMNAMYEPLPSAEWTNPVFEDEDPGDDASSDNLVESIESVATPDPRMVSKGTDAQIDETTVERLRSPSLSDEEPFGMLLLGVDERAGDRGRSDTMILLAIHPKTGQAAAISIPGDTRVAMPNSGKYDKINHAYAFGGIPLSVAAVEQLFGVPIAYYMKTNMEGLVSIVDTLGGVDVDNQRAFDYEGYSFPQGMQHLDGHAALAYSRMRKEDPQGDFGRTQRQREILSNAIDRVVSVDSIAKLPRLLSQLSTNIRTNLTSQNMIDLAMKYRPAIVNVETLNVQGTGKMINGIYYYTVTPEERKKIQAELFNNLGVKQFE